MMCCDTDLIINYTSISRFLLGIRVLGNHLSWLTSNTKCHLQSNMGAFLDTFHEGTRSHKMSTNKHPISIIIYLLYYNMKNLL